MAANDGGICPNGCAPPHESFGIQAFANYGCTGIDNIRENHGGAAENVVFQFDSLIDRNVILHLYVVSDDDSSRDEAILAK
jgi:hypothetical protein